MFFAAHEQNLGRILRVGFRVGQVWPLLSCQMYIPWLEDLLCFLREREESAEPIFSDVESGVGLRQGSAVQSKRYMQSAVQSKKYMQE